MVKKFLNFLVSDGGYRNGVRGDGLGYVRLENSLKHRLKNKLILKHRLKHCQKNILKRRLKHRLKHLVV